MVNSHKAFIFGHQLHDANGQNVAAYCWQIFDKDGSISPHTSKHHLHAEKAHITVGIKQDDRKCYSFHYEISAPYEAVQKILVLISEAFETQFRFLGLNTNSGARDTPTPTLLHSQEGVHEYEIVFPVALSDKQAEELYLGIQKSLDLPKNKAKLLEAVIPRGTRFIDRISSTNPSLSVTGTSQWIR